MNSFCLSSKEYWDFLNHFLGNKEIEDEDFLERINRATIYWDLNIIGSNCFLSRIFEKKMKKSEVTNIDIENIYDLTNKFYFTIDQLETGLIDDLFRNYLPEQRNEIIKSYIEAKRQNDSSQIIILEEELQKTFEKDLINILEAYYARQN